MTREAERKRLKDILSYIRYTQFLNDEATTEFIIDRLLDNGIVVPPCKVGDVVYKVYDIESVHRQILELEVLMIEVGSERKLCLKTTKKYRYNFDKATFEDIGKTVFLTREQAEKALRKEDEGK